MIKELRTWIEDKKSKRQLLTQQISQKNLLIQEKTVHCDNLTKARWILSEVAKQTQTKFKEYVENLVTMAIRAVYEDRSIRFLLDFEINRNKSEALMRVQEGTKEPYTPEDEMGGGIIDMIGMALRIVLWSIESPRSRNVIIADEPMKNLGHGKLLTRAGNILKEISHKLGFQLILVTHEPELVQIADKAWRVTHNGVHSEVAVLKPAEPEAKVVKRKLLS